MNEYVSQAPHTSLRSLRRLCFHRCLSVHSGVCIPACTGQGGACPGGSLPDGCLPKEEGVCPGGEADTAPDQRQTTPPPQRILWDMVNKRMVRIPLECILVYIKLQSMPSNPGTIPVICLRKGDYL